MDRRKNAWINLIFLISTLIINGLGATGFFNGLSQKEISDRYLTLITPSPSTFRIWSVIYLLLITSLVVMIIKKDKSYYQKSIEQISSLFRVSCILNIVWIISFSYLQLTLSTVFILGFVIVLSVINLRLKKIQKRKRILLPLTFGMYTGWLFIATVVNFSATLVKLNWQGFGVSEEIWAVITLIVAVLLVFFVNKSNENAAFPLPIAWAYLGIYQFLNAPEGFNGEHPFLSMTALAGLVVLIGIAAIRFYLNEYALFPVKSDE
jgi:hypothetical protein